MKTLVQRSTSHCPICARPAPAIFECSGHEILECAHCAHRFCGLVADEFHAETHYDDEYFFGGGAGYADYLSESGLLIAHGERYARLLDRHKVPVGDMLDVGAAAGFVMRGFANRGWNPQGVEPNESMAGAAADAFGFPIRWGDLESFQSETQFDLITMIQVVAHFHDVHAAMSAAAKHTKNGGHWLIETWNHRSLTARMFGTEWHEYSPPSVLQWFSPASLTRLAAEYGMTVIARGRPRKFIKGGHARSLLDYRLGQSRWLNWMSPLTKLLPENLTIPYPAEDLFWLLLRKDTSCEKTPAS